MIIKNRLKILRFTFLSIIMIVISCTPEENDCETKTVCYQGGNSCIETPILGKGNCY